MRFKPRPVAAPSDLAHALFAIVCIPIFLSIMGWRRARAARRERRLADLGNSQTGIALSAAHRAFWSNNHVPPSVPAQLDKSPWGDGAFAGPADTKVTFCDSAVPDTLRSDARAKMERMRQAATGHAT